jgi:SAM-dependent methyltransferase
MGNYDHRTKGSKPIAYFAESWYYKKGAMERVRYIMAPIMKYHGKARSILEIGCGMGDVLVNLPKRFSISGLDYEEDFIEVARKRMPKGKFYVHSMHNFKIDEKFDVIFSAFDAVNFLEDFSRWKSTFKAVSEHLKENGLFVFDVFTPKMLTVTRRWFERHRRSSFSGRKEVFGYYFDRGLVKGNKLTWDSRTFERLPNGLYKLNRYRFIERIYPVARMKSALSKHFDILETSLREKGNVIVFVCRKR